MTTLLDFMIFSTKSFSEDPPDEEESGVLDEEEDDDEAFGL